MDGVNLKEASLRNMAVMNSAALAAARGSGGGLPASVAPVRVSAPVLNGANSAASAALDTPSLGPASGPLVPIGSGGNGLALGGPGSLSRGLPRYVRQPPIEAVVFAWGVNEDGQIGNLDSEADVMQPKVWPPPPPPAGWGLRSAGMERRLRGLRDALSAQTLPLCFWCMAAWCTSRCACASTHNCGSPLQHWKHCASHAAPVPVLPVCVCAPPNAYTLGGTGLGARPCRFRMIYVICI